MGNLNLENIDSFCGSQYIYDCMGSYITEGVQYVLENGYSWVVTDALVIIRMKLRNQDFVSVKLRISEDNTATIFYEDGNNNVLFKQHYSFTDAVRNLDFFFVDNVLMLSQEY